MKRSDATVLAVVGAIALIAGFWFAVLAPKRSQVSSLDGQVQSLEGQIAQQRQTVNSALAARSNFAADYKKLVVLGKAVPGDSEQASLLVQLSSLADRSGVQFESLDLSQGAGATSAPAPAAAAPTSTDTTSTSTDTTSTSTSTTDTSTTSSTDTSATTATPAATEETAALTPLGAAVGPAGLPVMPYDLTFTGGYFQIATFLHRLDALVHTSHEDIRVRGRLLTVNSFDLSPADVSGGATTPAPASAALKASLSVTTYLAPPSGTTGGATPTGPAPATSSTAVPSSSTTSTSGAPTSTTPTSTPVSSTP